MHEMVSELFPICRSITGNGFRQTMKAIAERIPLQITEVPSGTKVLDWTVPREWNISAGRLTDPNGSVVADFENSNLHVMGYSVPVKAILPLSDLRTHLHTLPEHPDWIPYRTSYYREDWGFCLAHNQFQELPEGNYEVLIDSTLEDGSLTFGECLLEGESREEVLISCHCCHPSLANDNLSGIAVATFLADVLKRRSLRYTYRFLFIPGTIGSISWLALHEDVVDRIKHGLVVTCVGDPGPMTYKRTRHGDAVIDQAVLHVLEHSGNPYEVLEFTPYGYDERQYSSPGFDIPVGSLMRTPNGRYPEYHTSADNLDFVRPDSLADSLTQYARVIEVLEGNRAYLNLSPKGEPQLGKRGLYSSIGGRDAAESQMALLWVLNQSDGTHSLLDIAERARLEFASVRVAATALENAGLLEELRK